MEERNELMVPEELQIELRERLNKEISFDLVETFTDSFDEVYVIIQQLDLSQDTIDNLKGLIKKDIKQCIRLLDKFFKITEKED